MHTGWISNLLLVFSRWYFSNINQCMTRLTFSQLSRSGLYWSPAGLTVQQLTFRLSAVVINTFIYNEQSAVTRHQFFFNFPSLVEIDIDLSIFGVLGAIRVDMEPDAQRLLCKLILTKRLLPVELLFVFVETIKLDYILPTYSDGEKIRPNS